MSCLYIIGNGFDLAHNLDTQYSKFKEYLIVNKKRFAQVLEGLCDMFDECELWSSFESALKHPKPDFTKKIYKIWGSEVYGKTFKEKLQDAFESWISFVNKKETTRHFNLLPDDIFLSFNYTSLLEFLYNIEDDRILHIHNFVMDRIFKDKKLIFGHNSDSFDETNKEWIQCTKKHTDKIYHEHSKWFENLKQKRINLIKIIGFSYGEIDDYYFIKINMLFPDIHWVLYAHNDRDEIKAKEFAKRMNISSNRFYIERSSPFF